MNDFLDIYTLVFLALAVFVIFRLRAVLGQRTGHEKPPFDPFRRPDAPNEEQTSNVIPLPQARPAPEAVDPAAVLKGIAAPGSPVAQGLAQLMAADSAFDPRQFVSGARAAYEMIVLAFARGDRAALKDLLSKDVLDSFVAVIAGREQRGETVETTFVSIDKAEVVEAELKNMSMQVTMRFASKLITATKDRSGSVIDGSAEQIVDLIDVWTFAREAKTRDPNWRLVSTEADA